MESDCNTVVMPVECGGSFGLALATSGGEVTTVEGVNPLVCGAIARPTIEVVIASSSNNVAVTAPSIQSALIPRFMESESFQVGDEGDEFQGFAFPKHELSSDGVICHNLNPCGPQSDTFEVQVSETCQRRFVMFDQSGSKSRIIFHPSLLSDFPTLLQFPQNTGNCWKCVQDASTKALSSLKETLVTPLFSGDQPVFDTLVPSCRRSALTTNGEEDLFQVYDREGCCQSRISDCLSRENSEDLEALLWSDDEVSSTGCSPSYYARSNTQISSADGAGGYSVSSGKKRKAVEEGETEGTATSGSCTSRKVLCRNSEIVDSGLGYDKESLSVLDLSFTDVASSGGSTNNLRQHEWHNLPPEPTDKKDRKEKLQGTLHILRSIIPGGESMDTALVLDEAVQFVKNLQVELQKLEAKKAT